MEPPDFKETIKTAAQKKGLQYENRVGRFLKFTYDDDAEVVHGPWIEFRDNCGRSICQPDFLVVPRDIRKPIIVVEVKLSHVKAAKAKLKQLYCKLVEHITGRKTACVQVYKNKEGRDKCVEFTGLLDLGPGEYRECPWV